MREPRVPGASGYRVLLVEDDLDNQRLLLAFMRSLGFEPTLAENGWKAMTLVLSAWCEGNPYDLVLMDMEMPVLDGRAATSAIRAAGYSGPILALTANVMAGERERCLAAGCDAYLTKPISRRALLAGILPFLPPAPHAQERMAGVGEKSGF